MPSNLPDLEVHDSDTPSDFFEDGANRFWIEGPGGDWIHLNKDLYKLELKNRGLTPVCDHKSNQCLSDLDAYIHRVVTQCRVQYAGALAGWRRGVQTFEDTRALVIRNPSLITPRKGDWTILSEFLSSRFSVGDVDQLPYLLGWWQHTLQSLYEGRPSRGMAAVLAGEAGCGKTLLKDIIKVSFGNREVYPYDWMIGRDNFNKELTEAVCWTVDDESADTSGKGRNAFGAQIKKVVANTAMRCRGLYKDGLTLEPLRRLIICVNCEPDKLQVLPELADDINDKLLIFMVEGGPFPMPMRTEAEKRAFFDQVRAELPSFIWHLLHDYRMPDHVIGSRFGVAPFANAQVVAMLHELSSEAELEHLVEKYIFGGLSRTTWTGTAAELIAELTSDEVALPRSVKSAHYFRGEVSMGKTLGKLHKIYPDRYRKHRLGIRREWIIVAKNHEGPIAEEEPDIELD